MLESKSKSKSESELEPGSDSSLCLKWRTDPPHPLPELEKAYQKRMLQSLLESKVSSQSNSDFGVTSTVVSLLGTERA